MSRNNRPQLPKLDAKDIKSLSQDDIAIILRGADSIISSGGRSMLAKILKGSRDKKLLALKLDDNPSYGYYEDLKQANIMARIDWVILNGYLKVVIDWKLPVLLYTQKGWEIERETYAQELLSQFDVMLAMEQTEFDMLYLKDRARDLISILLDQIEESGEKAYIPILQAWAKVDYKKVRQRIASVIQTIEGK